MLTILSLIIAVNVVLFGAKSLAAGNDNPGHVKGRDAGFWHGRYVKEHRSLTRHGQMLRHARADQRATHKALVRLQQQPRYATAAYAIKLASSVFRVSFSEMWAVAGCETGHTFNPYAKNRSSTASGLFQFLDSTWAAQGISGFSVFDPVANALGAARIVAQQGWRQWSCRP